MGCSCFFISIRIVFVFYKYLSNMSCMKKWKVLYWSMDSIRRETIPFQRYIKIWMRTPYAAVKPISGRRSGGMGLYYPASRNGGMRMTIGWIGAGKVGFSLGRYFAEHRIPMSGYYSRNPESAKEAAEFTGTGQYERLEDLVRDSEVIFITVPDDVIPQIWEQLKALQITGKVICHCSGVLSSEVFSDIAAYGCCGYSIHPLLAVNDKLRSYKELSNALFTIEGSGSRKQQMAELLQKCGNQVLFLKPEDKVRYHAAAVLGSNLVLGLAETAIEELMDCGFSRDAAKEALAPFLYTNVSHLLHGSPEDSLTGPLERCDMQTVQKHLDRLTGENRDIYRLLSRKALMIAKRKNPERDYEKMEEILQ